MASKNNFSNESKDWLIKQFSNANLGDKSITEILSCLEEKFLHDTAINFNFNNTFYLVFVNTFSRVNKDKNANEIAKQLDIVPETYREILSRIYEKFEQIRSLKLNGEDKARQVYQQLWIDDFYEWFDNQGHLLLCRRSNKDRRNNLLTVDRRQNIRGRLITDFKIACVKGKLDRLQDVYNLCSYSFIKELNQTLAKAIYKYEFKDKATQNLSSSAQVIEKVISIVRQQFEYEDKLHSESTEYNYLNAIIEGLNPIANSLSTTIIGSPHLEQEVGYINENLENSLVMLKKYRRIHGASKHGFGRYIKLMTLLENIRDKVLEKYNVIVDRRKLSNRRSKSQVRALARMTEAS